MLGLVLLRLVSFRFPVTINIQNISINLTRNAIAAFFRQNDVLTQVNGMILDVTGLNLTFFNSSIVLKQSQLPAGRVNIYGMLENTSLNVNHNHSVCFEYINNATQSFTLNFEVPYNLNYFTVFKIRDIEDRLIENAAVYVEHARFNLSDSSKPFRLLCQRLTNSKGRAKVYGESVTIAWF